MAIDQPPLPFGRVAVTNLTPWNQTWPPAYHHVRPPVTCKCGLKTTECTVATETKKVGKETVVFSSRRGLLCEKCGIVGWLN